MTHASGHTSISDPVFFLLTFRESLLQVRQQAPTVDAKGKGKCWEAIPVPGVNELECASWEAPLEGWTKVNVDGSFVEQTGKAGVGVIIRNVRGEVIFTLFA